jgi:anti-sigma regulatory factor (Ser/Thr protein kinase)
MEGRLFLLRNDLSELERLSQGVSSWCGVNAVSAEAEYQVNLALDEIVSNVIRHGWKDGGEHQLRVSLSCVGNELTVEVEDDARPFNPLEAPPPDLTKSLEERAVGGLGIHLVRQIMDGLEYRRQDGRNFLVMKKRIAGT